MTEINVKNDQPELNRLRQRIAELEAQEKKLRQYTVSLKDSERFYLSLVNNLRESSIIINARGLVLFSNRSARYLFGLKPNEFVYDLNVFDIVDSKYRPFIREQIQMAEQGKGGIWTEYKIQDVHKHTKWVEGLCTKIPFGTSHALQVILRDITQRIKAEMSLRESENRYRSLFNYAADAIFLMDGKSFLDCNPKALSMFGCRREDIINHSPLAFSPERQPCGKLSKEMAVNYLNQVLNGEPQFFEWVHLRMDGTPFYCEISLKQMDTVNDVKVLAIIRNIEDRKKADAALRESEEKYRTLVEKANDAIIIIQDSLVKYVNPRLCKMRGEPAEKIIEKPFLDYVHPEEKPKVLEYYRRRSRGEEVVSVYETRLLRYDGSYLYAEVNASLIRYEGENAELVLVRDVTDRYRAESALRKSEEKMRAMFQSFVDGIFVTDMNARLQEMNESCLKMFGYRNKNEVVNERVFTFIDAKQRSQVRRVILQILHSDVVKSIEFKGLKRDGSKFPVEISVGVLKDDSGTPVGFVGTIKDVTDRKHLEEQLQQSRKMEAIGKLAGGIAHDFNNLLTVISGYSELALVTLPENAAFAKNIGHIRDAASRAEALTRQLLAFSRKQVLQPKVVDLNTLVLQLKNMLRRIIGENVELITRLAETPLKIKADSGQLEQVIMNLVINARDAMPNGGKLQIGSCELILKENEKPVIPSMQPGRYVKLSVSDTGMGMDEKIIPQIFEPFFTTKPKGKGTGLGLSTVYGIIKQSGGYITVDSAPGKGTAFEIYFPLINDTTDELPDKKTDSTSLQGCETILVVEDEDDVRLLVTETLRQFGYKVLEASNGLQALELCRNNGCNIDLVLTDVIMPKMSGREMAEKLNRIDSARKILYMSGYTDEEIAHQGVLEKGVVYLPKPFTPHSLGQKVRQVLDGCRND
ncbi:MAG: PAS domain S-box protein [Calditrichia bacterium]